MQCEIRKEVLAELSEFDPYSAFEWVKQNTSTNFICQGTLMFFLRRH